MFSERLKTLRIEKGLTQSQLAQELGISNKTISVYEKGTSLPTFDTLAKIASYFETTTDFLIGYSDERNPKISKLSSELSISPEAVKALILLAQNNNGSNTLSLLLENKNFAKFLSYIALYLTISDNELDDLVHSVFDDPVPLSEMPHGEKRALMFSSIKSRAVEFLEIALDELTQRKSSPTE